MRDPSRSRTFGSLFALRRGDEAEILGDRLSLLHRRAAQVSNTATIRSFTRNSRIALTITDLEPGSGNLPPNRHVPDTHDLDPLVVRQFPTNGSFGKEGLTAHRAHGRHCEFLRDLQGMHCIVAVTRPKIGRHRQRAYEDESSELVSQLRSAYLLSSGWADANDDNHPKLLGRGVSCG